MPLRADLAPVRPIIAGHERRNGARRPVWLFVATCASTVVAYAFGSRGTLAESLAYGVTVMAILVAHEAGHYAVSRHYGVATSLPYFLPFPISPFGTLGAIIRMRARVPSRRALFDIAIAGPLAGLVVAVPCLTYGLARSRFGAVPADDIVLGSPPLLDEIARALGKEHLVLGMSGLHPMAFAAWAGLFVTALNLLPAGQLDGGHIVYAVLGRAHRVMSRLVVLGLLALAIGTHAYNWLVLAVLVAIFTRAPHPPTRDEAPLDAGRVVLAILMGAVLWACFTPVPFELL